MSQVRNEFRGQLVAFLLTIAASVPLAAQASYVEGFENAGFVTGTNHGPSGLIAAGWTFRNQSNPISSGDWRPEAYAYQGNRSLRVDATVGLWFNNNNAEASSWAILPAIPGQISGDVMQFRLSSFNVPAYVATGQLEVRYSPSGQTGTGSGANDVGDFTILLASIPDPTSNVWNLYQYSLPGSGRLALRFRIPPASSQGFFWGNFQIDNLSIGSGNQGPPIPAAGSTVHWTAAMSPITITNITTIPSGGTVVIDPGVVVNLAPTATLTVQGSLSAIGTQAQSITLQGSGDLDVFGSLILGSATVALPLNPKSGSSVSCGNASFTSGGWMFAFGSALTGSVPTFIDIDLCTFDNSFLRAGSCTLRLTRTAFTNSYCEISESSLIMDAVSIDGSPADGLHLHEFLQPTLVDNVSVTNSTASGIKLGAANAKFGLNVNLTGNQHPVQIGGSGLLKGSLIPTTGNVNDHVKVEDASMGLLGGSVWTDVGVPYVIASTYNGAGLEILEGVRVQLGPQAMFWGVDGPVRARGTPALPVVFEPLVPSQPWHSLQKFRRLENCVIDGAVIGARFFSDTYQGFIDNSIIKNCTTGTQNDVVVRKTRFINNAVASWNDKWPDALTGTHGANSFVGNGVAVDPQGTLIDAQGNWWNDPSGPTAANNPGGNGEVILGGGAMVSPFLTAAPDYSDDPPIVKLSRHSYLLEPNSKVILTWSTADDVGVVAHRIEFDHPLGGTSTTIVANGLTGTQQSYEWTVPNIGFVNNDTLPRIRVVAIDTAGQEGWDASVHLIPTGTVPGTLTLQTSLAGPFVAGSTLAGPLCWVANGVNPTGAVINASILLDADRTREPLGGVTNNLTCLAGTGLRIPFVSSDSARVALELRDGTTNQVKYFFSSPFEIRPDARLGDAPPSVTLITPAPGSTLVGGSTVPITWVATDDEQVRAINIQASYDGGRTWHFIQEDLPGSATGHAWQLPASSGIPDVRVRVIAVDKRFQNSSDGASSVFQIVPSGAPTYPGSSEDLTLATGVNGSATITPDIKTASPGDSLEIHFESPSGTFVGDTTLLVAESFLTGMPPSGPAGFPQIHVDPNNIVIVTNGPLPAGGQTLQGITPFGLAGHSILFQTVTVSTQAGNGTFATTHAHEFRFIP